MATLSQNIHQAISDFADIKGAIEDKGVEVPADTPTSEYADLIGDIQSGDESALISLIEKSTTNIEVPQGTTHISYYAFYEYFNLVSVTIPNSVTSIGYEAFAGCTNLVSVTIPNSVTSIELTAFAYCESLTRLTLAQGFNCDGLNIAASTLYSVETILSWFNALADRTGQTAYTLRIGSTNLNKMTAEQIAIATNKNWNLA